MSDLELAELDIPTLAMLTGEAVRARVTQQVHDMGFTDIRPAHGYIFQHLIDRNPTVGELASLLGMTQQGASKLVVELEKLGYVSRTSDPADHRVRRIALTGRGTACITAAREARAKWQSVLVRQLGASGTAALTTGLAAFAEQLGIEDAVRHRQVQLPPHEQ
ncbi:MarR family [Nocardia otitidiscaviarum]|uniref:MarR family n=1 Tax=Nocardia otitidiscaviarum TaxID=1823 RepID=A0A378YBC5_9NOCA|nr:MarR family transcriptional regulator [Nocardia otitidiscaviarum]MCP9622613.1 MarR family transcriptional regulator [Nocardia otitidiscaviarum]QDP77363.1 MarR family transcriptional regulator [Nocardia otitidiscaviarum]SUA73659.1 MarR family [Nocardia otitidiscaviarum]